MRKLPIRLITNMQDSSFFTCFFMADLPLSSLSRENAVSSVQNLQVFFRIPLAVFPQLLYLFEGVGRHNAVNDLIGAVILNHADHDLSAAFFYSFSFANSETFSFAFYDAFFDTFSFSLVEKGLCKLLLIKLREYHIIQLLSRSCVFLCLSLIHPSGVFCTAGICHSPFRKGRLPILQFNNSGSFPDDSGGPLSA
ncbi:MAG: hypothetical protein IKD66_02560, partial [Solobacterium sp.]|nr:hypothetical protein [Solobacterium sp.]